MTKVVSDCLKDCPSQARTDDLPMHWINSEITVGRFDQLSHGADVGAQYISDLIDMLLHLPIAHTKFAGEHRGQGGSQVILGLRIS